jgi:hypothetical protein
MGRSVTFEIAGKSYNKSTATALARDLLDRYGIGEYLNEEDSEIAKSFYELRFGVMPCRDTKFLIDSDGYGYKCFHYTRKNESPNHFSFVKSLKSEVAINKRNVLVAFRVAVDDQVQPLRKRGYHVDHVVPFHVLLSDFLRDRKLSLFDVHVVADECAIRYGIYLLADQEIKHSWAEYHKKHAKLRTITARENLRKGGAEDLPLYFYRRKRNETYDAQYIHDCP